MTTIAWDGKSIAGDRLMTIGGTPVTSPESKIRKLTYDGQPALAGHSGTSEYGRALVAWIADGCRPGDAPELRTDEDNGCAAMVCTREGVTLFSNSVRGVFLGKIRWAMGSGADYALGAMAAGASAKRAAEIAIALDVNSGFDVDVLKLGVK